MEFKSLLSQKVEEVNSILTQYLPKTSQKYDKVIYEAIEYSLISQAKRIRPILMQETFKLCQGCSKAIFTYMTAIEMIHTYSLIHDDLPALDDDDYRRGRLSCHKKYGESIAILAGDALLNLAFELMIEESLLTNALHPLKAMKEISKASGLNGMIGGQVVDIITEGKNVTLDCLDYIHKNKTSAIIEASLTVGAILAEAREEEVERFRTIGRCIGLAFQIQDDILDVIGKAEILGKSVGSDAKNGKITYVTLIGLEASKKLVTDLTEQGLELLAPMIHREKPFIYQFIHYLRDRNK